MKKLIPISILALALNVFLACKEGTNKTKEVTETTEEVAEEVKNFGGLALANCAAPMRSGARSFFKMPRC